jgi:hypothetical protein
MPLVYILGLIPAFGIIYSLFAPLPGPGLFVVTLCILGSGIRFIYAGFRANLTRPTISFNSNKHRKLQLFAVFFYILTLAYSFYLTHGGSLYEPGLKYKTYVSATKEGVVLTYKNTADYYAAKRAVHRNFCALALLVLAMCASASVVERNAHY